MLATPTAEVAHLEGWDDPASPNHEVARQIIALEHEVLAGAAIVHAISDAIVSTVQALYDHPLVNDRTKVAHIGRSDVAHDDHPHGDPRRDPPMVLFIGRLEPRKGIDVFLAAAGALLSIGTDVTFVVAGDNRRPGPDGERYPDAWFRTGGARSDQLEFVGEVGDDDLDTLIRESSVVVMPSLYESFGLVVVEAMMHGRPAVASAVGGLVELIEDGVTGRLVPPDDASALADAIRGLLADPVEARAIGVRARQYYVDHLTVEAAAERVERILRAAIDRTRQPTAVGR
jgi:glycosyltransferase involved in cell wall biosynthesis